MSKAIQRKADVREALKAWRAEKEARGRPPIKRPFSVTNKQVHDVRKSIIPLKTVSKNPVTKPTTTVIPQVQVKSSSNQENEDLRKKLDDWKKQKLEKKQENEQNRRFTFIPKSQKNQLPFSSTPFVQQKAEASKPTAFNRRQTIIVAKTTTTHLPQHETAKTITERDNEVKKVQTVVKKPLKQPSGVVMPGRRLLIEPTKRMSPRNSSKPAVKKASTVKRNSITSSHVKSSLRSMKSSATSTRKPTSRIISREPNVDGRQVNTDASRSNKVSKLGAPNAPTCGNVRKPTRQQTSATDKTGKITIHRSNQVSTTFKARSNLINRGSPRNGAGVKRLSVTPLKRTTTLPKVKPTTKTGQVGIKMKQPSVPPSIAANCKVVGRKEKPRLNSNLTKSAAAARKSILKPSSVSDIDAITNAAIECQDENKTPPIEAREGGVRFTVPAGEHTPRTPRTGVKRKSGFGMTPEMARRKQLNDWLASKGKTPSRFRHLCCFDEQISAKKKRKVSETVTKPRLSTHELTKQQVVLNQEMNEPIKEKIAETISRVEDTYAEFVLDAQLIDELKPMLAECLELFEAGCPSVSVLGWLDDIAQNLPRATSSAAYWICRTRIVEESGDDHTTVDLYEEACRHNAQPAEELLGALKKFVTRMNEREQKAKEVPHTPRKTPLQVQTDNIFASSSIKYCMLNTTPFFQRLHSQGTHQDTPINVITPVRRSTRRSLLSLPSMLRDHDVILGSLNDVPGVDHSNTLFYPNDAIIEDEYVVEPAEAGMDHRLKLSFTED